jgi:hypothetical protein
MKKRLILSLAIALLLIATLALPAVAAEDEQQVTGSVSVGETISITFTGAINFGSLSPGDTEISASGQTDNTTPAITITVEDETNINVDIGIKGVITTGSIPLNDWLYGTDFTKTGIGLSTDYAKVYSDVGHGDYKFFHWITIPSNALAGTHTVEVSYKAVATGTAFP